MDPAAARRRPAALDPHSWRTLARSLLGYARWLGAPLEEAEDLVHDTLVVTVAEPGWYDPDRGSLPGALKVVLRNRLLNARRAGQVRDRHAPALRLVEEVEMPLDAGRARANRQRFLALLEPGERDLFGAWLGQRADGIAAPDAARALGLGVAEFEAAKKRLRRRCLAILTELELDPADLFDPEEGP